ncbi:ABC transporter substrate-binding protein [Pseudoroseomonas cervicalis]|uniref:ABC transporter substrate-binding protein n=1 Tax=Teichococcus cervicalis TaxID=204525 RepID=UPI002787CA1A|nr:ABC transporter substrate-binding protein [Pseudoroseomonas cervicalis]MDQ1081824.1 NitT/TauT family transport system substrate-binding protein [Pseudoroseomonas cervicalis]
MPRLSRRTLLGAAAALPATLALPALLARPAHAEASRVRLSHGYGILYLPLIVMRDQKLLEKHAARAELGPLEVSWQMLDGGNVINDAMLAGSLDIAGTGAPGFVTLWSRARGIPRSEIIGVSGMSSCALVLNTNRPHIRALGDFTPNDKIALPGIKTSLAAVVLQMLVAKQFGQANYARLDPMTVGLPHPEAYTALMSGRTEIAAHFASPPYSARELADPKIHKVIAASEVLGDATLDVTFAPKQFVAANPRIMTAFLAAMDEANALIANDKPQAAAIFNRVSPSGVSDQDVVGMLSEPDTHFSTTPKGLMEYARFMGAVGSIRNRPETWQDLFMPGLHGLSGS